MIAKNTNGFMIYPHQVLPKEYIQLFSEIAFLCSNSRAVNVNKLFRKYIIYQICLSLKKRSRGGGIRSAEFGVWKGNTSLLMTSILNGRHDIHYIFDSFEGLSPSTSKDEIQENTYGQMSPNYDHISQLLPKAVLQKCWIPQQLKDVDCAFDIVHIDLDLYEPISGALDYLVDKSNSGCIIIVDDYRDRWRGCISAVAEHMEKYGHLYLTHYNTMMGNYVMIRR